MALEDLEPARELEDISREGYDGVQFTEPATPDQLSRCEELGLRRCSSGRVNKPTDVREIASRCLDEAQECVTLHVGWGLETDREAFPLIEAILRESERIPLYVETHRATIFQDMCRTVGFVRRFPELRFNGDFSHWYTGLEMVYGGFEQKLAFIASVIERVRFIHGRIGTPGCIQVHIDDESALYVQHFREIWTRCFRAAPDTMLFVPELLSPRIYYGHPGSDRWAQSLVLRRIATECFAISRGANTPPVNADTIAREL
jgi:hypothetical protein